METLKSYCLSNFAFYIIIKFTFDPPKRHDGEKSLSENSFKINFKVLKYNYIF